MRTVIFLWLLAGLTIASARAESSGERSDSEPAEPDGAEGGENVQYNSSDLDESDEDWFYQEDLLNNVVDALSGSRSSASSASLFTRTLSLACPSEPAANEELAVNQGKGAKIILHRAGDRIEPTIVERRGEKWRDVDVDWLVKNGLDLDKPTIIYMMGWKTTNKARACRFTRQNVDNMSKRLGGRSPINMLIFEWASYSYGYSNYGKSVSMVPHLGETLAAFLGKLNERHHYKMDQVHLVSYSLSTHIAGYAGRQLINSGRGQLNQITAIDPTGVCFQTGGNSVFEREYGLRPSDAKLVVVRHYNMNKLGASGLIGGVDVLVNGGQQQPLMAHDKCNKWRRRVNLVRWLTNAMRDHRRAIQHEVAPFNATGCQEVAYECSSFDKYKRGQCATCGVHNRGCLLISTLGNVELNRKASEVMFKPTGTQMHIGTGWAQYCTHNYQVLLELESKASTAATATTATTRVAKEFERGQVRFHLGALELRPEFRLELASGRLAFTQLLELASRIEEFPERVRVQSSNSFQSIRSLSINYMSNISAERRRAHSMRYCPADDSTLVACKLDPPRSPSS